MVNEKIDPRKHAAMIFAKKVAERIEKALHEGSCRGYALVVAPRFLGILRNALGIATSVEPYATVDKEMVGRDVAAIEELLANL